jgi:hypothetical protein
MSVRSVWGLDAVDVGVQAGITACGIFFLVGTGADPEIALPALTGVSLMLLSVRRWFALRRRGPTTTGEVEAARLAEMEDRLAELETMHQRMAELEERVDFAERLVSRQRPAGLIEERGDG